MSRVLPGALTALLSLGMLTPLTGCNENREVLIRPAYTEVFHQNPPTMVDILLVVDNSGSMEDEQVKLSDGFDAFVEFFDVADIDYHIGVVTMDTETSPGELVLSHGTRVIDRSTEDADIVFRDMVQVGVQGSAIEKGLESAMIALTPPQVDGVNGGFFRDDALLSIIFVSDEEDSSIGPVNDYINELRDLKGQRRRDAFNASALVGLDVESGTPAACGDVTNPVLGAQPGWRYWDVARQTGGVSGSICSDTFGDIVNQMGLASSRLRDSFALEREPDEDSIEVTIARGAEDEGVAVPPEGLEDGKWAWEYVADAEDELEPWQLRFVDQTQLPPVGARVVVRYEAR